MIYTSKMIKRLAEILHIPLPLHSKEIHFRRILISKILNYIMKPFDFRFTLQTKIINSNLWDHLIILDACRYDYFEQLIYKYLDGVLCSALSPGSNTIQWLKRTWTHKYPDIVYFSTNPYVNSKVVVHGFNAKQKFGRILDLGNLAPVDKLGLVHPQNVNTYVKLFRSVFRLKRKLRHQDEKLRFVIHYMQPHFPYINMPESIYNYIAELLRHYNISGETAFLMLSKYIFKNEQQMREWIKKMYLNNLAIVLRYVAELIPYLDGRIIITADHGELLGEYGMYYHLTNAPLPYLRVVPLFVVK